MDSPGVKGIILLFAMVFIIAGCAIGNRYDYSVIVADFNFSGNAAIIVAVHDQRGYIRTESKKPDFIGLQRSGWPISGVPHDVCTENGKPLADNIAQVISQSLSKRGFKVTPVVFSYADKTNVALNKIAPFEADRLVLVIIEEWKTDTLKYSKLIYSLTVKVFDSDTRVLAIKTASSAGQNIGTEPEVVAPRILGERVEDLMNDPSIAASLINSTQEVK
jgi:hypothetical protein